MPRASLLLRSIVLLAAVPAGGYGAFRLLQATPDTVVDVHRLGPPPVGAVHFGGPDRPSRALATLLRARIDAVPAGGRIAWATYYFRDLDLARALIRASDRGVRVTLTFDGSPRLGGANAAAIDLLRRHGLGGGLVLRQRPALLRAVAGRLHSKIYMFSHPTPVALIGSFNPSGDADTDRAVIDEIGDQDRGHNLLVEVTGAGLVAALEAQVQRIVDGGGSAGRFGLQANRIVRDGDTDLFFYPRLRPEVVERAVDALGPGDRMWGAISHLKADMVDRLARAGSAGARIELVVHDTERRVPEAAVARLRAAGVDVRRYAHPDGLPMHAKFLVLTRNGQTTSYVGSLNYNRNSRWLNDEVLMRSGDAALARALIARHAAIGREIDGFAGR
ncbi:phospholipase D-like domain-containing protein [Sphingomonas sp.]|uniref:phospholipase D-like domain-containing protein n=1 Tax=Sphingomonas sp. TaxID=28214 RepID=UPI003B3ACCE7